MKAFYTLLIFALMLSVIGSTAHSKQKIGVYDSRIVAIWYYNSPEFRDSFSKMMQDFKKAKEDKDTAKIKELEGRGPLLQRVLHDKGFGRGSVASIMEKRKTEIDSMAKAEKLTALVSMWELNYLAKDVEKVDVTLKLLKALKAGDNIIKMYDEMKGQPPVEDAFFMDPRE